MLIGLVADLISVNRRLSEEMLIRLRKMKSQERRFHRDRQQRPGDEMGLVTRRKQTRKSGDHARCRDA